MDDNSQAETPGFKVGYVFGQSIMEHTAQAIQNATFDQITTAVEARAIADVLLYQMRGQIPEFRITP